MRYNRTTGLMITQMQELVRRVNEALDEPWNKHIGRPKSLGLYKAVEAACKRHGLRSAITPIVTAAGLDIGILLGGAILTETVFNIPGIGRLAFDAIQKSDLPIVQGTVLIAAFAVIMANLIVDILYAFLDPRVRY